VVLRDLEGCRLGERSRYGGMDKRRPRRAEREHAVVVTDTGYHKPQWISTFCHAGRGLGFIMPKNTIEKTTYIFDGFGRI